MRLPTIHLSRRTLAAALAPLLTTLQLGAPPAQAFNNAIPEFRDEARDPSVKKTPGPPPAKSLAEMGPRPLDGALKPCLDGKPHCFSSSTMTGDKMVDTSKIGTGWIVKPWSYSGMSVVAAIGMIREAVDAYPPGQGGIDEGGFKVLATRLPTDADGVGYVYVQFESGSRGYIDDMEFSAKGGIVNVRTTSRLGYLDLGVNAKRYNWFAKRLGAKKGWTTSPIRAKEHLDYFAQNELTDNDVGL